MQHALRKSGYDCHDKRTLRLVSLAAQKFLAGVLDEAVNVHKRRKLAPAQHLKAEGYNVKDKRVVLITEDLSEALKEVGVVCVHASVCGWWWCGWGGGGGAPKAVSCLFRPALLLLCWAWSSHA